MSYYDPRHGLPSISEEAPTDDSHNQAHCRRKLRIGLSHILRAELSRECTRGKCPPPRDGEVVPGFDSAVWKRMTFEQRWAAKEAFLLGKRKVFPEFFMPNEATDEEKLAHEMAELSFTADKIRKKKLDGKMYSRDDLKDMYSALTVERLDKPNKRRRALALTAPSEASEASEAAGDADGDLPMPAAKRRRTGEGKATPRLKLRFSAILASPVDLWDFDTSAAPRERDESNWRRKGQRGKWTYGADGKPQWTKQYYRWAKEDECEYLTKRRQWYLQCGRTEEKTKAKRTKNPQKTRRTPRD